MKTSTEVRRVRLKQQKAGEHILRPDCTSSSSDPRTGHKQNQK